MTYADVCVFKLLIYIGYLMNQISMLPVAASIKYRGSDDRSASTECSVANDDDVDVDSVTVATRTSRESHFR